MPVITNGEGCVGESDGKTAAPRCDDSTPLPPAAQRVVYGSFMVNHLQNGSLMENYLHKHPQTTITKEPIGG